MDQLISVARAGDSPAFFHGPNSYENRILAISLYFCAIMPALALDVGDISSFMNSDASVLSKEIKNTTESGRLINIHVERLSSPLEGGGVIPMDSQDEVLLTPASLLLPAKSSDVIRFSTKDRRIIKSATTASSGSIRR